ncbi:MAG TPA: PilZ domain-containing protein [Tepidisphaeraceae bacterium]|nr:PilZ domain-containing protein [Tepidisphaeraceae bacterium]
MTTLHEYQNKAKFDVTVDPKGDERRQHRRHDMEQQGISIDRWDGARKVGQQFGQIVDLSAGGVRIRTEQTNIRADQQVRVRIELPDYAGIAPFIQAGENDLQPKREWVGWMAVARVMKIDEKRVDVAGRLVDMDEMDRGMLGLYLSTQPLAA